MNVSNKPSDQKEQVDEFLYRQIGATSHLQDLDIMEDFNFPIPFERITQQNISNKKVHRVCSW